MSTRPISGPSLERIKEKKELRFNPYQSRLPKRSEKDILAPAPKKHVTFFDLVRQYRQEKNLSPFARFAQSSDKKD